MGWLRNIGCGPSAAELEQSAAEERAAAAEDARAIRLLKAQRGAEAAHRRHLQDIRAVCRNWGFDAEGFSTDPSATTGDMQMNIYHRAAKAGRTDILLYVASKVGEP